MPDVIVTPVESDTHLFQVLRPKLIGASEAPALVGKHPYKTRLALALEKLGRAEPQAETRPMRRGKKLEPVAIELLIEDFPRFKIDASRMHYRDESIGLGATPDVRALDPEHGLGVIQIKSVLPYIFKAAWHNVHGELEPPEYVAIQANVEAHLVGARWAAAAAIVVDDGIEVHLVDVPISEPLIGHIRAEAASFWQSLAAGRLPDPDFGRDHDALMTLYGRDRGETIDLTADNELPFLIDEREALSRTKKLTEAELDAISDKILHKIGTAATALFTGGKISAKTIDVKESTKPRPAYSYRPIRVTRDKAA